MPPAPIVTPYVTDLAKYQPLADELRRALATKNNEHFIALLDTRFLLADFGGPPGEALRINIDDVTTAAFLQDPPLRVRSIVQSTGSIGPLLDNSVMGVLIENWSDRPVDSTDDRNDGTKLITVTNRFTIHGSSIVLVYDTLPLRNGTNAMRFVGIATPNRFRPIH